MLLFQLREHDTSMWVLKFLWEQCRGGSGVVSIVCFCQMKEKEYLICFLHYRILNWLWAGFAVGG